MVLSGRTGSGKTAILQVISQRNPLDSSFISLPEMSMSYVTNSDYITFLGKLGVDLDLFFQALWKHVICLEYVRSTYKIVNSDQSRSLFGKIAGLFSNDDRRKRGIEYLKKWETKFWVTMDENIREVTRQIEGKVELEFGGDIEKFRGNAGFIAGMSELRKQQYEIRAKKIINSDLLVDLSNVVDVLVGFEKDRNNHHRNKFILIDKIDEKWVDEKVKYQMIRALLECLKSLRKIRDLKVLVALRSDVFEKVAMESNDPGMQRDKYDDFFVDLSWTSKQLQELTDKRMNYLYRFKYTKSDVHFNSIFSHRVGNKDPFDYMAERTLLRPRDVISFVNLSLGAAEGKNEVNAKDIKEAEAGYSRRRFEALIQEWFIAFPWLESSFSLVKQSSSRFSVSDIPAATIDEFSMEMATDDRFRGLEIQGFAKRAFETKGATQLTEVTKIVLATLYRIGAIGLKLTPNERYRYSHIDHSTVLMSEISLTTKVHVHPMLQRALGMYDDVRLERPGAVD